LPAVFFYISGHGFGHASRQIEIIKTFGRLRPDVEIVVKTTVPSWLFEKTADVPITLVPTEIDTGVVQIDSLHLDERRTVDHAAAFYATLPARAAAEAEELRRRGARLVIADAPPLPCAAAALAGLPSFVVSNFTWDWIYEAYADARRAGILLETVRAAYRRATGAWRLPMHGGFATFESIVDVPFVARHARHDRAHVRRVLGLPPAQPLALTSFGGYGVRESYLSSLDCLSECGVIVTVGVGAETEWQPPPGIHLVRETMLYAVGLRYEDLVSASDFVVTKPGYGIIAECVANNTAILYTDRGHFVEYDVLVREMPRFLRCEHIDHDALFAGRWRAAVQRLLSSSPAPERPPTNGADVVAGMIAERMS
jgi:L-arabinokinase